MKLIVTLPVFALSLCVLYRYFPEEMGSAVRIALATVGAGSVVFVPLFLWRMAVSNPAQLEREAKSAIETEKNMHKIRMDAARKELENVAKERDQAIARLSKIDLIVEIEQVVRSDQGSNGDPAIFFFVLGTITNSGEVPTAARYMRVELVLGDTARMGQLVHIDKPAILFKGDENSHGLQLDPNDNLHESAARVPIGRGEMVSGFVMARFADISHATIEDFIRKGEAFIRWTFNDVRGGEHSARRPLIPSNNAGPWTGIAGMNSTLFENKPQPIIQSEIVGAHVPSFSMVVFPPPTLSERPQPNPPQSSTPEA